jgi:hypothetical protein
LLYQLKKIVLHKHLIAFLFKPLGTGGRGHPCSSAIPASVGHLSLKSATHHCLCTGHPLNLAKPASVGHSSSFVSNSITICISDNRSKQQDQLQ